SARLNLANDDLLASANSSWHDWRALDPQWMQSRAAERHRHKIRAVLGNEFGDEPLFFVKDPRICRFASFISSILAEMEVDTVAFLPIRNP
ncbi:sulfotransferase family protein, partial [Mesorhizobium sp. Ld1326N3]